jgi:DHA1 family inner membrane transport protein
LISLTVAGFAIGCNEFVAMGLLPQAAAELSGRAADAETVGAASVFVWAYAAGVVVGAPFVGAIVHRLPVRAFITVSLVVMAVITLGVAQSPTAEMVIAFRFLSGIPHAAFLGVAAITAGRLLGTRHAARGVAIVIGGLTIASMIGAPFGTWLGQAAGWRSSYLVISALFAVAAVGCVATLRSSPEPRRAAPEARGGGLANGRLWVSVIVFAFVNAGLFAVLTFIAPLVVESARGGPGWIPAIVAVSGAGMTAGNYVGGAAADRSRSVALALGVTAMSAGYGALMIGGSLFATRLGFVLIGFALGALGPYFQTALMAVTAPNPELGSSMNSLAANAGSVLGGAGAGVALVVAGTAAAAVWVGVALSFIGCVGLLAMRSRERSAPSCRR